MKVNEDRKTHSQPVPNIQQRRSRKNRLKKSKILFASPKHDIFISQNFPQCPTKPKPPLQHTHACILAQLFSGA